MNEALYRNFELQQLLMMDGSELRQKTWQELLREEEKSRRNKKPFLRRNGR